MDTGESDDVEASYGRHAYHDLSEVLTTFQILKRLYGLLEWEDAVYPGANLMKLREA